MIIFNVILKIAYESVKSQRKRKPDGNGLASSKSIMYYLVIGGLQN